MSRIEGGRGFQPSRVARLPPLARRRVPEARRDSSERRGKGSRSSRQRSVSVLPFFHGRQSHMRATTRRVVGACIPALAAFLLTPDMLLNAHGRDARYV